MFFTKEWLEKRYSYVVYRRGSGYLGVQISSGGRNRQGVQPGFPGISSKYASYGMERTGSFLLVAGMPGWHPGSAGRLRHHPALRPPATPTPPTDSRCWWLFPREPTPTSRICPSRAGTMHTSGPATSGCWLIPIPPRPPRALWRP